MSGGAGAFAQEVVDLPAARETLVARVVRQLSEICLEAQDGAWLGLESDLMARLGVSRPTLRQAAKILENDHLLSVRRGAGGGLYAARPDPRQAVQSPALYLRMRSATLGDMNEASRAILPEAAFRAAECQDPAQRARLRALREALESASEGQAAGALLRREAELARLIGEMSGNPVLMLFTDICYAFGLLETDLRFFHTSPARIGAWLETQRQSCDAILQGDGDIARLIAQRRGALIEAWIKEDRPG